MVYLYMILEIQQFENYVYQNIGIANIEKKKIQLIKKNNVKSHNWMT